MYHLYVCSPPTHTHNNNKEQGVKGGHEEGCRVVMRGTQEGLARKKGKGKN